MGRASVSISGKGGSWYKKNASETSTIENFYFEKKSIVHGIDNHYFEKQHRKSKEHLTGKK